MNDLETLKAGATGLSEPEDLRQRCDELERQAAKLRVALVVLSCALCAFIGIQWKQARAEMANVKPTATQLIQGYQREKPSIDAFLAKLGEYGRTHPDFQPILGRYGISISPAPAAATAVPAAAAQKPAPGAKK